MFYIVFGAAVIIPLIIYFISTLLSLNNFKLKSSHVVITGGSSGIGKAVASEVIKRGANVTLLARSESKLIETKTELDKLILDREKQKVNYVSVDVGGSYEAVQLAIDKAVEDLGPVDILVNSAGVWVTQVFEDIPIEEFKRMMDTNYLGSVYATRAVIRQMKSRQSGRIVFVSSMAGQLGSFGYSGYSATKFALRGLAEALQMEVKPYNIRVCLSYPPDTDTPGYQEELKTIPAESLAINATSGVVSAERVAKCIVDDSTRGRFSSYIGVDGWLLDHMTVGMSPMTSIFDLVQQVLLMGLLRLIGVFYLHHFNGIIKKHHPDRLAASDLNKDK